jgi:uncharacterized lipoprotein YbaY
MKKIMTVAVMASGALALAACGAKKEEAPAEPAETEMMAPAEESPAATDEAAAASEDVDPTGNPIGMDEPAAAEAPAAE